MEIAWQCRYVDVHFLAWHDTETIKYQLPHEIGALSGQEPSSVLVRQLGRLWLGISKASKLPIISIST